MSSDLPSGCSIAWTSEEPTLVRWRALVDAGNFADAEQLVAAGDAPAVVDARALMPRLRWEWSLTTDELLTKLLKEIPDATASDVEAWTTSGALEARMIDGQRRYFRREPRNLLLFDAVAKVRAAKAKGFAVDDRHDSNAPIIPVLAQIVALHDANPTARELMPIRTRYQYTLIVRPDRPGAKKGSSVRAWLPFPQVYGPQRDVHLIDSFPRSERVSPKTAPQRTVYFEQKVRDPSKPIRFEASFEYTTRTLFCGTGLRHVQNNLLPEARATEYLAERPPHIVFTEEVKRVVGECSKDSPDKRTLAKRLWNWVDDHIAWRAEHEYCLLPAIPQQAMKLGRGDCGTQALALISLCRCAGIPARWQSGFTTDPQTGGNLHDWCEIWLDDDAGIGGWIPVDPSYGKKAHADERVRDFYFGHLDPYRLIVNLDYGRELTPPMTGLRAEPLDFQRGEVEVDGRVLYYDEWDYAFSFEHESL